MAKSQSTVVVLSLALVLLVSGSALAQDCEPLGALEYHSPWSRMGANIAPAPAYWGNEYGPDPNGFVPDGEVWRIEFAGVAIKDGDASLPREYTMHVEHKIAGQGDACCWLVPAQPPILASGTPTAALTRHVVLKAGQRLGVRTPYWPGRIAVLYLGWKYPASCLSTALR